jgi:hypothetical protein
MWIYCLAINIEQVRAGNENYVEYKILVNVVAFEDGCLLGCRAL